MNRYRKIIFSVTFFCSIVLPWQVFGASITEKHAAIGEGCDASGDNSTAMGSYAKAIGPQSTAMGTGTEASGTSSTAMGFYTTASGPHSTAIGAYTIAGGAYSFAGGRVMELTSAASGTFIWGYSPPNTAAIPISTSKSFLIFPVGDPGKVGIGTPQPASKLDIKGAADELVLSRLNQIGNKNWCGWRLDRNTSEKWFIGMGNNNDNLVFRGAASKNYIVIEDGGQVGICTDAPKFNLHVNGTAGKPHGGTWLDASDERLKTNINELSSKEALAKLAQLRGITFEWINTEEHAEGLRSGILAQELEVVFPEWVEEVEASGRDKELIPQGEKAKAISFPHDFNAYLIEAIKELKTQNERQQAEIEELRFMIKELTNDHQQIAKR